MGLRYVSRQAKGENEGGQDCGGGARVLSIETYQMDIKLLSREIGVEAEARRPPSGFADGNLTEGTGHSFHPPAGE